MENKIKAAFEQIQAEDALKERTRKEVSRRLRSKQRVFFMERRRFAAVAAIGLAVVLTGAGWGSYALPVAAVSIDVNPSVELRLNVYDRVIGISGYNEDGIALAEELSVKNMKYTEAISEILDNETVEGCMENDGLLEVTVAGNSQTRIERLQNCILEQTDISVDSIYCLSDREDVEAAHEAGLSFGKYRAYLELREVDPDISLEEAAELSMREIRALIVESGSENQGGNETGQSGSRGNGNGSGTGQSGSRGNGNGSEAGQSGSQGNGNGSGKNQGSGNGNGGT